MLPESRKSVFLAVTTRSMGGRIARGCLMASRQADVSEQHAAQDSDKGRTLNFKVSEEFKREFKGFAASQGLSMTDLLKEGFALTKKKLQKG